MLAATELRGEFTVIIADERNGEVIAIRDRCGVKPIYYAVVNDEVFFASEIKALLALGVPATWDIVGAIGGMCRPKERTEFAGVSAIPKGFL
jgi:asparagine synthase (glutamine-hydrolysing)